ncbi:MAG: hypothetical protein ACO4BU_13660, partial [Phycisphaerales bacterium]
MSAGRRPARPSGPPEEDSEPDVAPEGEAEDERSGEDDSDSGSDAASDAAPDAGEPTAPPPTAAQRLAAIEEQLLAAREADARAQVAAAQNSLLRADLERRDLDRQARGEPAATAPAATPAGEPLAALAAGVARLAEIIDADRRESGNHRRSAPADADLLRRTGMPFGPYWDSALAALNGAKVIDTLGVPLGFKCSERAEALREQSIQPPAECLLYQISIQTATGVLKLRVPLTVRLAILGALGFFGGREGRWLEPDDFAPPEDALLAEEFWATTPLEYSAALPRNPARRPLSAHTWRHLERAKAAFFCIVVTDEHADALARSIEILFEFMQPDVFAAERLDVETGRAIMNSLYLAMMSDARGIVSTINGGTRVGPLDVDLFRDKLRRLRESGRTVRSPDISENGACRP